MKRKNKKHKELYFILFLVLFISVGFAYLSAQLDIIGNATVKTQSWDVHFETITESTATVSSGTSSDMGSASITTGDTTEVTFASSLPLPGDFYEFTVNVVNGGSINAMLSEATNTTLTTDQQKYLDYTVTYADGSAIAVNDAIHAGKSVTLKIRVEYKKNISASDLPGEDVTFNYNYGMTFVQADSNANYKTTP